MTDKDCNNCRWQVGEKGECDKYNDCFDCPMCTHGGKCKCLMVPNESDCPYWEPMKEEETMNEQCKTCGWLWEKCDEHIHCSDCPMNNVEIDGHKWCYCNSIASKLSGECPYYVPRKESGDEDNTEM